MSTSHLEAFLKELGHPGKYQCFICTLLLLNIIPLAINNLNMVFIGVTPPHHCKTSPDFDLNETIPTLIKDSRSQLDQCHMYLDPTNHSLGTSSCKDGWVYSYDDGEWGVVGEWDLVCTRKSLLSLITTLYFAGTLIGSPTFGFLVDKFGRKPLMMLGLFGHILVGCVQFVSSSYVMFTVLKVTHGIMLQGMIIGSGNLNLELFGQAHRTEVSIVGNTVWSISQFFLVFFAFFLPTWRWFYLATTLPSLIVVSYFWLIPESLRWLLVKNRTPEATAVAQRFVRINKLPHKVETLEKEVIAVADGIRLSEESTQGRKNYDWRDLFRTPGVRKTSFVTFYCWFSTAFIYYGISFVLPTLAGNKYVNFLIGAGIELASRIVLYFVLKHFGRRLPACFAFVIAGILCIIAAVMKETFTDHVLSTWLTVGCALLGKAVISLGAACSGLLTLELFPTVIRGIAGGYCGFGLRVGAMTAPQILLLGELISPLLPLLVFGMVAVVAGLLVLLLPETGNDSLPDTIEDAEKLHARKHKTKTPLDKKCSAPRDPNLPLATGDGNKSSEEIKLSHVDAELAKDVCQKRVSALQDGIHNPGFTNEAGC